MKNFFVLAATLCSVSVYSQDTTKIKQVDSLVKLINGSDYKIQKDSIKEDHPEMGLSMTTYLTMVTNGTELKKYVNNVHATTQENGKSKQTVATNTFYFDHNKLIKVEEFAVQGDRKMDALWYYADDKPIYYTLKSDKSQERADMLLTIAKGMVAKMRFK